MPTFPNVIANNGGALTQTFVERGPQGPSPETMKRANRLTPGTDSRGNPAWVLATPPPVGDKGTQRTELVHTTYTPDVHGNIALPVANWVDNIKTGGFTREGGRANYNPQTGNVFISDENGRPATLGLVYAAMRTLAAWTLPVAPLLVPHPEDVAGAQARVVSQFLGYAVHHQPVGQGEAPNGSTSPMQLLMQNKTVQ